MQIGGFQRFTLSDYPGKPSAIVFTQGCNFRCPFCHNRYLWSAQSGGRERYGEVFEFLRQRKGLLQGVVITGGEPTLQDELPSFIRDIKEMGYSVKLDTNGSNPQVVAQLIEESLIDYCAMDIKAPMEKYALLSGVSVDTDSIMRTIRTIHSSGLPCQFRTTVYPRMLSDKDVQAVKTMMHAYGNHLFQPYREPDTGP